MKDYQNDKYENFFLHLKASRENLAAFGDFTATALAAPGTDALLAGHGQPLAAAVAGLRTDMVGRQSQDGASQSRTSTEGKAFESFKAFIKTTDKKVLAGYLYDHADEEATYYPDGLSGLTQALVKHRLTRLTAYTEALEAAPDAAVQAQGSAARTLLKRYVQAAEKKTTARTALQDSIADLGPAAVAVAEALWDVHTAALYAHRRQPLTARKYFDYARLPSRANARKPAPTPKTT